MRLHRMVVSAFGPFAGTEEIDFDALTENGLFLLHGATGAGKTSVLDAVCFALYGTVPGPRQGSGLRSDHAAAGVPTEVRLDFTVRGRRLEITRRPQYQRPGGRTGTTTVRAQTLLREWKGAPTPGWTAASSSHQEVGEEVKQLLGMSREQFCQVVLLPQGDFARFLRGDAKDRAALLGRLFDTGRFAAVERWLADRRLSGEKAARAAVDELLHTVHRLHQAAGSTEPPPAAETPASWPQTVEAATVAAAHLRTVARERRDHTALALHAAEQRHQAVADAAAHAAALADRQTRLAAARARAAELDAVHPSPAALADRLERARRAAEVLPLHRVAVAAAERAAAAEAARDAARARLDQPHRDATGPALTAAETALRQELARLADAAEAEAQGRRADAERAVLRREAEQAEAERDEADRWLAEWPGLHEEATERLRRAQSAADRTADLAEQLSAATEQWRAAEAADRLEAELAAAEAVEARARADTTGARERWLDLRERRLDGMAAELAGQLTDGRPCPVCGGREHPAPATAAPGQVTRADEDAAERAVRAAERAAEDAGAEVRGAQRAAAAARSAAAGRSTADLAEHVAELTARHTEAHRAAADAVEAATRRQRLEAEHTRRLTAHRAAGELLAARTARIEALDTARQQLAERLARARGGDASLAARIARLTDLADRCTTTADAARTADDARRAATAAADDAARAATAADFPTPTDAARAALDPADHRTLRHRLDQHHAERAAVQAVLDDPELTAAAALPPADRAAAAHHRDEATAALRRADTAHQTALARCAELDRLGRALTAQARRIHPLLAEHALTRQLADLAAGGGENTLRMRLESYVLAARLEQVAVAASHRLRHMSAGRYTLAHSDARAAGNRRSGLGLRVVDAWTGTVRDTATLSGGESFFASLALALGLADVVTEEAGGTRLDTLFIDEGFGSLDPQTLDDVLDVLDGLRAQDRAVGIVSHVPELRQRVPTQLSVVRRRHGSTLRVTVPAQ